MRWLAILVTATLLGQTAPRFDVASIKPTNEDRLLYRMASGGALTANSVVVNLLLFQAFGVPSNQIVGGPAWLESDRFDIQAKAEGIPDRLPPDQERAMLVGLLEERFQLKYHREKQERPVFELSVARGGAKLPISKVERGNIRVGPASILLENQTVDLLARVLSDRLGRPVIDKTGLTGDYDITLEWMPDLSSENLGLPGTKPRAGAPAFPDNGKPSLLVALQEQLGLRLDSERAPVEVIVIDHIERPSAN